MKPLRRHALLLLVTTILAVASLCPGCSKKPADADDGQGAASVPVELSSAGMAKRSSGDLAFRYRDLRVSWGELESFLKDKGVIYRPAPVAQPNAPQSDEVKTNGLTTREQKAAFFYLRGIIQQQALLAMAREAGTTVTEEDKLYFAKRWEEDNPGSKFDAYLSRFKAKPESRLDLSQDDMFLLLKFMDENLKNIKVPENELNDELSRVKLMRNALEDELAKSRKEFEQIPSMDGFQTDEGFKRLARELSDGIESDRGGVIDELMTRQEIAECNDGQPFLCNVGESSGLIETETSLRYIRVLKEIPGVRAGEPEKLEIAQILYAKREIEGLPSEEKIKKDLQNKHYNLWAIKAMSKSLYSNEFECPLFPNILTGWIDAK